MRLALLAMVVAAGCSSPSRERGSPGTDGPTSAVDARPEAAAADARRDAGVRSCVDVMPAERPAPSACQVSCPRLEPVGPVVELPAPYAGAGSNARVTFAGGRWYVAWEGGTGGTLVQRLNADGQVDGPALNIRGTVPHALLSVPGGQQLILYGQILNGSVPATGGPGGRMASIHRLDLDLRVVGTPLIERSPTTPSRGFATEVTAAGELVATWILERPGGLIRELRYAPGLAATGEVPKRDWRLGPVAAMYTLDRIGGRRVYPDLAEGWLRFRPLMDDGSVGAETRLAPVPVAQESSVFFVRQVGDRVWVGGSRPGSANVLHLRAVDAATGAPVGQPLALPWLGDGPYLVLDGRGTLLLMDLLYLRGEGRRPALVPIDPVAGACPASFVGLAGLSPRFASIPAMHFEGDTAGVAIDTADDTGARQLLFTRLRCAP